MELEDVLARGGVPMPRGDIYEVSVETDGKGSAPSRNQKKAAEVNAMRSSLSHSAAARDVP